MFRVLAPVDADVERARLVAETVVDLPNAADEIDAMILNVFEGFEVPGEGQSVSSEEYYDEAEFPRSVSIVEDVLESSGVDVTRRREHGDPATRIVEVAEEIDADAVVMGGRVRSPVGKVLFGSVTQSVLLSADRPVMIAMDD